MILRIAVRQLHRFIAGHPAANFPLRSIHIVRREGDRPVGARPELGQRIVKIQLHRHPRTGHDVAQHGEIGHREFLGLGISRRLDLCHPRANGSLGPHANLVDSRPRIPGHHIERHRLGDFLPMIREHRLAHLAIHWQALPAGTRLPKLNPRIVRHLAAQRGPNGKITAMNYLRIPGIQAEELRAGQRRNVAGRQEQPGRRIREMGGADAGPDQQRHSDRTERRPQLLQ